MKKDGCTIGFQPHTTDGDGDLQVCGRHINGKLGYSIFARKAPYQENDPRDCVSFQLISDYRGELEEAVFCLPPETMICIAEALLKLAKGESKLVIPVQEPTTTIKAFGA